MGFANRGKSIPLGFAIRTVSPNRKRDTRESYDSALPCAQVLQAKSGATQLHLQKSGSLAKRLNRAADLAFVAMEMEYCLRRPRQRLARIVV